MAGLLTPGRGKKDNSRKKGVPLERQKQRRLGALKRWEETLKKVGKSLTPERRAYIESQIGILKAKTGQAPKPEAAP